MTVSAIILAAGEGTRMRSSRPKPLHRICGRPMVVHGFKNKVGVHGLRLTPRSLARALAGMLNRSPEAKQLES